MSNIIDETLSKITNGFIIFSNFKENLLYWQNKISIMEKNLAQIIAIRYKRNERLDVRSNRKRLRQIKICYRTYITNAL